MRRQLCSALLASVASVATLAFLATPAQALNAAEADFLSRLNGERSEAHLAGYAVRDDLTAVARRQAERMAARGEIYHNPNIRSEVANWQAVGENVGRGPDIDSVHYALMNSPGHRANILDHDYTEVGMGTAETADGYVYVAQVFRQPLHSTAPKPAPARVSAAAPAPAPKRVAAPVRKPATVRPARVGVPRPAVVPAVDPATVLRGRLALAESAASGRPATGALDHAVVYLDVMSALGA